MIVSLTFHVPAKIKTDVFVIADNHNHIKRMVNFFVFIIRSTRNVLMIRFLRISMHCIIRDIMA